MSFGGMVILKFLTVTQTGCHMYHCLVLFGHPAGPKTDRIILFMLFHAASNFNAHRAAVPLGIRWAERS